MGRLQAKSSLVKTNKVSVKKQNLGGGKIKTTIKRSDNLFTCPFEVDIVTCPSQGFSFSGWGEGPNTSRIGKTTAPDGSNTAVEYVASEVYASWVAQGYLQYWKPYTKYEFSIWAKSTLGVATDGQIITVTKNSGDDRVALNASGNLTSTWQKFSITFTTGPTYVNDYTVAFFCADITPGVRFALWGAEMYRYG